MKRTINYKVTSEYNHKSIEMFLKSKGYTKQSLVNLKKMDHNILVNGEWKYLNYQLKENDEIVVNITENEVSKKIPPVKLDFEIAYEDEDIIVVNKPFNMPIHPSLNNYENTLGNALAYYYKEKGEEFVFRCINRLDKDTSGLTILAKHQIASGILYEQMVNRQIHRTYIALVEGDDINDSGFIDVPIGRKDGSTIERVVDFEHGEKAVTHYEVIDRSNGIAKIKLNLKTGRTHQIRVHMKYIGHPLLGDWLYNPDNKMMIRQALHSYELDFMHPITNEKMNLKADIPEDMKDAWENHL